VAEDAPARRFPDRPEFIGGSHLTHKLLVQLIALSLWCTYSCDRTHQEPFHEFILPVYKNANDITHITNVPSGTRAVTYNLVDNPSPKKVVEFYHDQLSKNGFEKYSADGEGKCEPEYFDHKRGQWEAFAPIPKTFSTPERVICSWADKEQTKRILLIISFEQTGNLAITCQIYPFFTITNSSNWP